jgi:hypothetical protein
MMKRQLILPIRFALIVVFSALLVGGGIAMERSIERAEQKHRKQKGTSELRNGDIVFQHSGSMQCAAVAQATHSPYTHCGIIFIEDGLPVVWEAVGPVMRTPFTQWVEHGVNGHVVVKRLKKGELLTVDVVAAMKAAGERDMGKAYDIYFAPDTELIYCSELVQRIYQAGAGVTIGEVQRFGDMDFSGAEARRVLKDRFGDRFPADQLVVTPASLFRSRLLVTVDSVGVAPDVMR